MIKDFNLTEHFTFYELTKTSIKELQEKNRELTTAQLSKLINLARLLEHVRYILQEPLVITSGYRCPELNKRIGSKSTSQHILCEAADFVVKSRDLGDIFRELWRDVKDKKPNVGQLIHETADRPYGQTSWIHISLGEPYRDSKKCGQILRMLDGKYTLLA